MFAVTMTTLVGEMTQIDVPAPGAPTSKAIDLLDEASRLIANEWFARVKAKAEQREWLQRVGYQLIGLIIRNGFSDLFEKRITDHASRRQASSARGNPFRNGLVAVFEHDKGALSKVKFDYLGGRLWYAYRHYVPHEFLPCFLHQVWTAGAEQRASAGFVEPLRVWIVMQRANDPAPERRGSYPPAIEEEVERVKIMIPVLNEAHGLR